MQSNDGVHAGSEPDNISDSKLDDSLGDSNVDDEMHTDFDLRSIRSMSSSGDYEAIVAADRAELTRVASEAKVYITNHSTPTPSR